MTRTPGNPGSAGFTSDTVTSPDGTSLQANVNGQDFFVSIKRYVAYDPTVNEVTYNLGLDISTCTIGVQDKNKLVLMKRGNASSPWQPFNSTLSGDFLWANGLNSFSDFTIGSNSIYNELPVAASAWSVE